VWAFTKLQAAYRGCATRRDLSVMFEATSYIGVKEVKQARGALRIQTLWRAYNVRRKSDVKVRVIRRKIKQATAKARPEHTLGEKTRRALDNIINGNTLEKVLKSCTELVGSTAYSPMLSSTIIRAGAVDIICQFIKACNRSQPHINLLSVALKVLYNLSKWRDMRDFTFSDSITTADVMADVMQKYRDNDTILLLAGSITLACLSDAGRLEVVRSQAEIKKRFESLHALMKSKGAMTKQVANANSSVLGRQASVLRGKRSSKKTGFSMLEAVVRKLSS